MLNIAGRALAAQQLALEVTSNNMANATTPGYRAETAVLTEGPPVPNPSVGGSLLGDGVTVAAITRASNAFLSRSVRNELGLSGYWNAVSQGLSQVQNLFQEPSSNGLQEGFNAFFNAWQTLSQNPESLSARETVIAQGKNVAGLFQSMSGQLIAEAQNLNQTLTDQTAKINSIASQIAQLNRQITDITGSGGTANDLVDQRSHLLDQLSGLANVSYTLSPANDLNIYVGNHPLVFNQTAYQMATANAPGINQVVWQDNKQPVSLNSGSVYGTIQTWNNYLSPYMNQLNTLASQFASQVNTIQAQGYPLSGPSVPQFFTINSADPAQSIAVNPAMTSQAVAAASSPNSPGDGSNALAMADLSTQTISALNATFNGYYTNLVGQVGIDGQTAQHQSQTAQLTLTGLKNARQSATGVDVNQQSAQLIQEEQSYTAAAKLVAVEQNTMASLLQAVG